MLAEKQEGIGRGGKKGSLTNHSSVSALHVARTQQMFGE